MVRSGSEGGPAAWLRRPKACWCVCSPPPRQSSAEPRGPHTRAPRAVPWRRTPPSSVAPTVSLPINTCPSKQQVVSQTLAQASGVFYKSRCSPRPYCFSRARPPQHSKHHPSTEGASSPLRPSARCQRPTSDPGSCFVFDFDCPTIWAARVVHLVYRGGGGRTHTHTASEWCGPASKSEHHFFSPALPANTSPLHLVARTVDALECSGNSCSSGNRIISSNSGKCCGSAQAAAPPQWRRSAPAALLPCACAQRPPDRKAHV